MVAILTMIKEVVEVVGVVGAEAQTDKIPGRQTQRPVGSRNTHGVEYASVLKRETETLALGSSRNVAPSSAGSAKPSQTATHVVHDTSHIQPTPRHHPEPIL